MLLGDAGHTFTPILGQGCNSGLEDALIFSQILQNHSNLDAALPAYTKARLPDIKALTELNEIIARDRFAATISVSFHNPKEQAYCCSSCLETGCYSSPSGLRNLLINFNVACCFAWLHARIASIAELPTNFRLMCNLKVLKAILFDTCFGPSTSKETAAFEETAAKSNRHGMKRPIIQSSLLWPSQSYRHDVSIARIRLTKEAAGSCCTRCGWQLMG